MNGSETGNGIFIPIEVLQDEQKLYEFLRDNGYGFDGITTISEGSEPELSDEEFLEYAYENIPNPSDIKKYLDKYVVGQEDAKKAIAVSLVNHLFKISHNSIAKNQHNQLKKTNILLIGDSGVGKSYIVELAAKYMALPYTCVDATKYTAAGYVGDDVEDMLTSLFLAANRRADDTEVGIIFIDEFDKLAGHGNKDQEVNTVQVQQALLKLVEGQVYDVPVSFDKQAKTLPIDTSNILFIFAGAFNGLAGKRSSGEDASKAFGFVGEGQKPEPIGEADILKAGIIPEILGRIGSFVTLDRLNDEQLLHILTKVQNNPIDQAKTLFKARFPKKKFPLTKKDYDEIIKSAKDSKLGARGLAREVNKRMLQHYYV